MAHYQKGNNYKNKQTTIKFPLVLEATSKIQRKREEMEGAQVTKQRLHYDMGRCYSLSFQPVRALESFLLSLTLSLPNGDQYPLIINYYN